MAAGCCHYTNGSERHMRSISYIYCYFGRSYFDLVTQAARGAECDAKY